MVAGINGFIGAALARRLRTAGWRVVGLLRSGRSWDRLAEIAGLELMEVEAYTAAALRRRLNPVRADVVFNLAAAGVTAGAHDPSELFQGNALIATQLLEAVAKGSVRRFVHVGSCSEYAAGQPGVLMDENWPQEPASPYGVAKLTATHLARVHAKRLGVPLVTLRLFNTHGPGEAPHRLVPALLRGLLNGEPVDLTPGQQQRDWLYIEDAVEAMFRVAAAEDLGADGRVFNVCTGQAASVRDVGEFVRALLHQPERLLRWGALPYRDDEPLWIVGDAGRFTEATGWQPRWTWRSAVEATVRGKTPARVGIPPLAA